MDIGIQKNGALSSSTYSLLRATKDKPGEINLKRLEGGRKRGHVAQRTISYLLILKKQVCMSHPHSPRTEKHQDTRRRQEMEKVGQNARS